LERTVKNLARLQEKTFEGLNTYIEEQFEKASKETEDFKEDVINVGKDIE